jgi:predicted phage terminase large subunit-like protein
MSELVKTAYRQIDKLLVNRKYEGSLIDFAEYVWPVVEPAIPFIRGWAIEAIADHLQAASEGHIKRLLINVPPGFTKSLLTDVFWPAWIWGPQNKPWTRFMCAAYSNHLTERDNMRCRNIVVSERYRRMWGNRFGISNEQFTKIKFANDKTGWKLATSVGGIGTGERADIIIIDDPNNPFDVESELVRETTKMWFTEIMPDRLNNPQESIIAVIQQRTHEDDVSGIALSREMGYTHLWIPMEYIPKVYVNAYTPDGSIKTFVGDDVKDVKDEDVFWEDPRIADYELAWPERFTQEICKGLERDKGPHAWAGQYQQTPEPRGGSIIKRHYWQLWEKGKYPGFEYILASLDTAYTIKQENDASALTIWGVFRDVAGNPKVMLIYAWQERLQFYELVQKVIQTCTISTVTTVEARFPVDRLLVESKASGLSIGHELHRLLRGTGKLGVELLDPTKYGDKVARVHAIQHLFADEMIYAPDKSWADMVIDQCALFPKGARDDLVDSTSQALRYLRESGFALRREEQSMASADELAYSSPSATAALYPF